MNNPVLRGKCRFDSGRGHSLVRSTETLQKAQNAHISKVASPTHQSHRKVVLWSIFLFGFIIANRHFTVVVYINKWYTLCMEDEAKKLGDNLKKIRTDKNITQTELARLLGVDKSFVSNIENGKSNSTLSTMANIAKVLEISIDKLLK